MVVYQNTCQEMPLPLRLIASLESIFKLKLDEILMYDQDIQPGITPMDLSATYLDLI